MKKYLFIASQLFLFTYACQAHAGFMHYFKNPDGSTKWQHIANFSSSVLILLLLITAIFLFFSVRRAHKANKELKLIRDDLEQRVIERTATLDESNRLLQRANQMLEGEISQHKETTALLQSSEAYTKSILDSMPLMLIGLNKDLGVTQWNNWAEKSTGIPADKVVGKYLWDAYPTITLTPDQINEVLEKGETVTIKHSQRGQYYFDITIYALKGHRETGLVVLVDDVTQQSKAENLLIQRDKFSAMGELAAAMAHDINIPLRAIVRDIHELRENISGEEISPRTLTRWLDDAKENSRQASAIISHLLEFSNSESQEKQLTSIPNIIDHSVLIAGSMFSDTDGLKFKDIQIERNYASDLPQVPCHISELQQVFLSLLRHACYSLVKSPKKSEKPSINISVSEFYDSMWIKIQHNGRGLTSDEQMTIFEPFYQNEAISNGCDLENRLSFSYFIITEHHHGQMAVTSDENVGSTFHIQLLLR
ncbi:two-component system sensor histidine kinase NtrB [Saccharophagus degradans]|uniref:histidine kinase n=1 Tax=Saccharophagus degradans (strain 2-40 / ATCC 43961 / DSM 17024) TaxID=203122 RepID=Q21PU7_SACD2|nr:ATP-binding protein [Saccharophagus degradans]ABD79273.1 putative protein histidine kinase [Saccharophagus degradans 2-40]